MFDTGIFATVHVFHIAEPEAWEKRSDFYEAESLVREGFIHCSTASQLPGVIDRFFSGRAGLVLLTIDTTEVDGLVFEDLYELGEDFPHVYGPIPLSSVVEAEALT